MALTLDERQRAMLLEMGVRVWLPGTVFETEPPSVAVPAAPPVVAQPAATVAPAAPAAPTPAPVRAVPVARPPAVVARAAGTPLDLGALDWEALADTAASCQACGLCAGRKSATLQPAPGQRDWMVVGDPPEEDEDRAAQAFVESPGLLLDNMLKAVGASRSADAQGATAAYATHVVKCRPPHGQIPQAADLAQCAQYLQREITLVQPKVILAVGRFAIQTLLAEHGALATQPLGKLRGTVYQYQGIPVIVTYHPKMLLRNSADKAKAWADLCLAMDVRDASVK
ncbi:uracil-DNA glycosylase [Rhodoferax sp. TS-BS-61-7]|uniref:uracil-DNA glycosylase n=1 Tax=Rhodoferax sp. TS-BS-61-7 TaxID=2094194 RepID=UPI000CF74C3A|nr:uracil-DNA glycosylase [Rhodoferax sp. TS-BS-61-7]PQA78549.1 uracil-DNA glycosylase [Rhodoferax sp. TS-BS-61-7]